MFDGILIEKDSQGLRAERTALNLAQLPPGNVLIDVDYSTLNYKDALAITDAGPVVRSFPMVPGIDLAGTVVSSEHPAWRAGDAVLLNGWGIGELHWGGLAQKARVNGDWLIPQPAGFTQAQAMAIGTAGYTAMLCIMALQKYGVTAQQGEVLVTGASGGVGSFAIALLAQMGYDVVASTGRASEESYLKNLGARRIIDRNELSQPGKALGKERWAGVVDSVGSHTLANACATTHYHGAVAACGLAQGMDLPATVAPFILRGVALLGIDSSRRPQADRVEAWARLDQHLERRLLASVTQATLGLDDVVGAARQLIDGQVRGRLVVDVNR